MQIWGKFFGGVIGFMFGRFFGALLGIWLGHQFDKRLSGTGDAAARQQQFFNTTFAVMGHIAKASGRVTENDIRIASMLMDTLRLDSDARRGAQQAFRDGKAVDFDLQQHLRRFRTLTFGRREVQQMFLEIQIQTALSDGELHPKELDILHTIARELGFSQQQLEALLKRWQAEFRFQQPNNNATSEHDAYHLLGLTPTASDQDVKRAYRKLMNEYHPDKLVAKGLPEEMMEIAKRKAQDIQAAYERVKLARGMR
ncbi:co-chaperone DjlA [Shewanella dokdonensis]|uniref:Co-chaperone protein DjlA n=1 Tax=Shewanella dokdonensis TaxID=712036 RepID=A0ABX8DJ00_9GAMM|nr:co-chaperone DjlA [Shewanella dokdonensis]MCL1074236.1 co-chaperone DjlA [Shewanella dokdonensis]QVK23946.1 co-chaperone DjlA [Shewanella dokdonensis]